MRTLVPSRPRAARDAGTASVELALVLPLLLVLVLGTIGFGRAFHTRLELANAAQEGVRTLVFRTGATADDARSAVVRAASVAPALAPGDVGVSGTCTPGADVTVTARRRVTFDYVLGSFDRQITGRAVMRCSG